MSGSRLEAGETDHRQRPDQPQAAGRIGGNPDHPRAPTQEVSRHLAIILRTGVQLPRMPL